MFKCYAWLYLTQQQGNDSYMDLALHKFKQISSPSL